MSNDAPVAFEWMRTETGAPLRTSTLFFAVATLIAGPRLTSNAVLALRGRH